MQKNKTAYFITGTDTDVGKTYIASALVRYFVQQGQTAVGMKPIAAGCEKINGALRNADVSALLAASNFAARLEDVNPYAFEPAIAPHIACLLYTSDAADD